MPVHRHAQDVAGLLRRLFLALDKEQSGYLTAGTLEAHTRELGSLTASELGAVMLVLDLDRDGRVSWSDFSRVLFRS